MDKGVKMFGSTMFLPTINNLFTGPAWRWERSGHLLGHGRQLLQALDDDLTWEAWRFRWALSRCRDDADREQIAREHPGLVQAHAVFTGELRKRWELEARLLGGDSAVSIAARCGISAAGVEAYRATFYEVRPHL